MFVPPVFELKDPAVIREILEGYDFGLLVTAAGDKPEASHLPFLYDPAAGPNGTLVAHMARANPQWRGFDALADSGGEALAVFQGPHAYVSPRFYASSKPNVPTWNYLAVHAYGRPRLIEEPDALRAMLERLSAKQESGRPEPWSPGELPGDFMDKMMKGIVGFEMPISRLEAKAKLNQNKPREQMIRAMEALEGQDDSLARATAAQMKALS